MENEENVMAAEQPAAVETEVQMDVAAETEENFTEKKSRQYLEVTQEMLDETAKRLGVMLDFLCLDASVRSEKRNARIHLVVTSSDAGRIIGRKGQSLESLQLLLNRMMQKDNVNYPKINIDIDGYPAKDGTDGKNRRAPKGDREDRPQRKDRKGGLPARRKATGKTVRNAKTARAETAAAIVLMETPEKRKPCVYAHLMQPKKSGNGANL